MKIVFCIFFDFMNQTKSNILDYILFYIAQKNIKISISDKKKKKKKENIQNQIGEVEDGTKKDINDKTNSSDIDSSKFFSLNENTHLSGFSNSNESNKEEKKLDKNKNQGQNISTGEKQFNICNDNKEK